MAAIPSASQRHRRSVFNWVNGNRPVVRSESHCLLNIMDSDDYIIVNDDNVDKAGLESLFDYIIQSWPYLAGAVGLPSHHF
jgi:hypothetical protein